MRLQARDGAGMGAPASDEWSAWTRVGLHAHGKVRGELFLRFRGSQGARVGVKEALLIAEKVPGHQLAGDGGSHNGTETCVTSISFF